MADLNKIIDELSIEVPGTEGRMLIGLRPRKVPRGTLLKKRNKNLVKLSDLLNY